MVQHATKIKVFPTMLNAYFIANCWNYKRGCVQ